MSEQHQRLAEALADSDFVIFDNDGVIYPYTPEIIDNLFNAMIKTLRKFLPDLPVPDILRVARESQAVHGHHYEIFVERHGLSRQAVHELHHIHCDEKFIVPDERVTEGFSHFHMPRAILSHGDRGWIYRTLDRGTIRRHFRDESIYAWEDVNFLSKARFAEPYIHVLDREGYVAERTWMIEDSVANLVPAKKLGMKTVLVADGQNILPDEYPHVDFIVSDLTQFLFAAKDLKPQRCCPAVVKSQLMKPVTSA